MTTDAPLPPRVAEPDTSDAAVQAATGKVWDDWLRLLDAWGAAERRHPEIARHLEAAHGLSGWWAQQVTVGYERARGLRAVNQNAAGFAVSVSKTLPVSVDRLFAAFATEAERDRWLEPGTLSLRTAQPSRSARFDVAGGPGRAEVNFTAKGADRASAAIQHSRLAAPDEVDRWRGFWKERLQRLAALLTEEEAW